MYEFSLGSMLTIVYIMFDSLKQCLLFGFHLHIYALLNVDDALKCTWIFFSIWLDWVSRLILYDWVFTTLNVWWPKFDMFFLLCIWIYKKFVCIDQNLKCNVCFYNFVCAIIEFDGMFVCLCICNVFYVCMFMYALCVYAPCKLVCNASAFMILCVK